MISRSLLLTLLVLLFPAAARAQFSLSVAAQSGAVVGRPMIFQVSGTIPTEYVWLGYYFSAHVIPTSAVSECPTDHWAAYQVARTTGQVLTVIQREQPDAAGNFSFPLAFTPWAPGEFLVCAYTDDGQTLMITQASLPLRVAGEAAPANLARPGLRRSGRRLVCGSGRWANAPTGLAYRWVVGGKARGGGRTLVVSRRLRGRRVRCSVTASNAAGSATAVSRIVRA